MAVTNPDDVRMSLGEHLEELRWRLILGLIGPVLIAIVLMFFGEKILQFLLMPLFRAQVAVGLAPGVYPGKVTSAFSVYLKISFIGGLAIGIPWLAYQLWQFVAVGLYPKERKLVTRLVPGSVLLTTVGLGFMYFVALPFSLWFLLNFATQFHLPEISPGIVDQFLEDQAPPDADLQGQTALFPHVPGVWEDPPEPADGQMWLKRPENQLRIRVEDETLSLQFASARMMTPLINLDDYISFVLLMGLGFAIAFQTPLVMLMLGWVGIFDSAQMAAVRRYAVLGCTILGAVLTPPDVMSMLCLAVPLYLLYELGIVLVRMSERKSARQASDS